jgi:hypothetical protein
VGKETPYHRYTIKKGFDILNDNGKSVSKGKVQPKTTKKQQWCSKSIVGFWAITSLRSV